MQINLSPAYISDASSAKRQPIPVDVNLDPTANSITAPFKQSRQNGYIAPIGNNRSLGANLQALQYGFLGGGVVNPPNAPYTPSTPTPTSGEFPNKVENLVATWDGQKIKLTFDFDLTDPQNQFFYNLVVQIHSISNNAYYQVHPKVFYGISILNSSSTSQILEIDYIDQQSTGLFAAGDFDGVEVETVDVLGQTGGYVTATLPPPVCDLPAPIITSLNGVSSYSISTTNINTAKALSDFYTEAIQEYITTTIIQSADQSVIQSTIDAEVAAQVSAGLTGWTTVNESTFSPISVYANDGLHRWVRSVFLTSNGLLSPVSNYVEATPQPLFQNNSLPPAGLTNASGKFVGDNVFISYTLPTISNSDANKAVTVKVTLNPTVASNLSGFFYHTILNGSANATGSSGANTISVDSAATVAIGQTVSGTGIATGATVTAISGTTITLSLNNIASVSGSLTFTDTGFSISSNLIFSQFGQYYSSYSGSVVTVSQYGTESSSSATLNGFSRTNLISSITPNATVSNIVDGYTVQFSLGSFGATSAQVYQFFNNPLSFISSDTPDYMDASWVSGGTTLSNGNYGNAITVNSLSYENGGFPGIPNPTSYSGYEIKGNGITGINWITSITESGSNYILTLANPLTSAASGNYHMQAKVYDGVGPANVFLNYYSSVYVYVVYYDQYGNKSNLSAQYIATPINPTTSIISNAVQIGNGGSIYVGSYSDNGSRIVLGPSGNKGPDGSSAYSGIFAFDYGSTSSSAASTAIITNPSASGYTFETTNAKIADWVISSSSIQNALQGSSNYVGMSATGTYSFWAGSSTSGGDSSAKFSVTPAGKVSARNITIYGSGNQADTILSASYFTVYGDGSLTATNANITGKLTVNQSSTFNSDITIQAGGYLLAGSFNGPGVILGTQGLVAKNSSGVVTTQVTSSPDSSGVSFSTTNAYLGSSSSVGAWIVSSGKISSNSIELISGSASESISIYASVGNVVDKTFGVQLLKGSGTNPAISVGSTGLTNGVPNAKFWVGYDGTLNATGANVSGNINAGSVSITNNGTINTNNFWNSSGAFRAGTTTAYISYDGSQTVKLNSGNAVAGNRASGLSSYIQLDTTYGVSIYGIPYQNGLLSNGTSLLTQGAGTSGPYAGVTGFGSLPRARMVAEDPITGLLTVGMAVYYQDLSSSHNANPSIEGASSGVVGDLWVSF